MHPDNIKAIRETERLLSIIKQHRDSIKSRVPDNDIRVSFFGLTGNVLHSLLLFFAATIQTIANPKWWKESYNKDSMTAQDLAAIKNLERLSKHSLKARMLPIAIECSPPNNVTNLFFLIYFLVA